MKKIKGSFGYFSNDFFRNSSTNTSGIPAKISSENPGIFFFFIPLKILLEVPYDPLAFSRLKIQENLIWISSKINIRVPEILSEIIYYFFWKFFNDSEITEILEKLAGSRQNFPDREWESNLPSPDWRSIA